MLISITKLTVQRLIFKSIRLTNTLITFLIRNSIVCRTRSANTFFSTLFATDYFCWATYTLLVFLIKPISRSTNTFTFSITDKIIFLITLCTCVWVIAVQTTSYRFRAILTDIFIIKVKPIFTNANFIFRLGINVVVRVTLCTFCFTIT